MFESTVRLRSALKRVPELREALKSLEEIGGLRSTVTDEEVHRGGAADKAYLGT
jgi:hypothetical protein